MQMSSTEASPLILPLCWLTFDLCCSSCGALGGGGNTKETVSVRCVILFCRMLRLGCFSKD